MHKLKGKPAEILYLQLMTDHHMGGFDKARVCTQQCVIPQEQKLAQGMVDAQQSEMTLFAGLDSMAGLRRWRDALVEYQLRLQCRGGCPIGSLGSEVAETNPEARLAAATGFLRWESAIRVGLQAMRDRDELDGDPEDLALATLAALQGGLLLTQLQRQVRPLEVALDSMLDHIESRTKRP
jgi:hypothetical protein